MNGYNAMFYPPGYGMPMPMYPPRGPMPPYMYSNRVWRPLILCCDTLYLLSLCVLSSLGSRQMPMMQAPAEHPRQQLGGMLYGKIKAQYGGHLAGRMTSMLLAAPVADVERLVSDENLLRERAAGAYNVIVEQDKGRLIMA